MSRDATPAVSGLRHANLARQAEWDKDDRITLTYRANELAGETGEACNVAKKLERERLGIRGSRATVQDLADELADVVICADLVAMHEGIDLDEAVERKFNATSEKVGLVTRLSMRPAAPSASTEGEPCYADRDPHEVDQVYGDYDGTSCIQCGRERVQIGGATGRRICEKCGTYQDEQPEAPAVSEPAGEKDGEGVALTMNRTAAQNRELERHSRSPFVPTDQQRREVLSGAWNGWSIASLLAAKDYWHQSFLRQQQGWVVTSGDGHRYRTWRDGYSAWTTQRSEATRYARRQDAEAVHAEDEDAWCVVLYATPPAQPVQQQGGDVDAIVRDIRALCNGRPAKIAWPHRELHAIADRVAALNPARGGEAEALKVAREALEKAESTFRWYGDLHAAKPDAEKAKRNYDFADEMAQALAQITSTDEKELVDDDQTVNHKPLRRHDD